MLVEYKLSFDDVTLVRREIKNSLPIIFLGTILPLIAIVFIEILMIFVFNIIGFSTASIVLVVEFPITSLLVTFIFPRLIVRTKKLDNYIQTEISQNPKGKVVINNKGIKAGLQNTSYDLKWSYFIKIIERDLFFYFYYLPSEFLDIPKRALSLEQIEKLRQLIINNTDTKTKIKLKKGENYGTD
ncbi:MAG: YcxB family protein [Candidatus Heimdallarchaeota archaeon]|nr:YcxB family protein [Candidatus Heimdallarchaeota archaeon]